MKKVIRHFPPSLGFTIIELLVVFTFIGILTSLGIASYSSYTSSQSVQTAATNFVNLLHTAQSRSLSQVIPSSCASGTMIGYEVDIATGGQQYSLTALCGASRIPISTAALPYGVTFGTGPGSSVIFNISSGTVVTPVTFTINSYNKIRTIKVSQIGNVMLQ